MERTFSLMDAVPIRHDPPTPLDTATPVRSYGLASMPWHKVRVFYDREAERRRRFAYQVNLSILVASAVLLLAVLLGIYPFVQFWFELPAHSSGATTFPVQHDSRNWPTSTQELCAALAVLCIIYISIALNFRTK
jgi:hypothetical protein